MADTTKEVKDNLLLASDMDGSQSDRKPGKVSLREHISSWRCVIYILLQFTCIAWTLPRSAASMAFVCINTKREEARLMANVSGGVTGQTRGENSTSSQNLSQISQKTLEEYEYVLGDIAWSSETKGLVLSAPLVLAFAGPILSDVIIQRFHSRYMFTLVQLVNAVIMFSSPGIARVSPYILVASHVLMGLPMNTYVPILTTLVTRWTPEKHKTTAMTIAFAGIPMGSVIASVMNGFLCSIPFDNGWPFIFYTTGLIHLIYAAVWYCLIADYPETHRFISEREKNYILSRRAELSVGDKKLKNNRPPYKAILTSVPVLSYIFALICFMWTIQFIVVYIPIYLNAVHKFTPEETGIIFAVMSAVRIVGGFFWSSLGNGLINKKILRVNTTRKTCILTAMVIASGSCLIVSFFDREQKSAAVVFVMLTNFCHGVSTGQLNSIPMDLAPRYVGTLTGIATSCGLLISTPGPLIVAALTPTGSYDDWRSVWYLLAAVSLTYGLVFAVLGSAKLQPWAAPEPHNIPQQDHLLKD